MRGLKCAECGAVFVPPVSTCIDCGATEFQEKELCSVGEIISWTKIHVPPESFEGEEPYTVAVIELEDGARLIARVNDLEENIEIGEKVELKNKKNVFELKT